MFGECHAHLFMDGVNYRAAVQDHKNGVNMARVREHLQAYQAAAVSFVRDGGDCFGVSKKAREIAGEYGVDYRTPLFAIHKTGHYGGIVGFEAHTLKEFHQLVCSVREQRGDFIKIMVSGLVDYGCYGKLSEEALEEDWIREMIHVAHEEGFSVMAHANGREAVLPAVLAGVDTIEHGNYIDRDCIDAMADRGCVWVPTIVTTGNLLGCGRYEDAVLRRIYEMECENLAMAYERGVQLALGSDAGAYLVPHGKGIAQEYRIFSQVLADVPKEELDGHLRAGEQIIREKSRAED